MDRKPPPKKGRNKMIGTVSQVEWAERIKAQVSAEFDRVAKTLESVARKQCAHDQLNTRAIIAILEEKRIEVMAKDHAGYFIREWQELRDQVRTIILRDSRYEAIKGSYDDS
jgi:hypothetical protein